VLHDSVIVPTSAIQRGAPGTFVYLVHADNTVSVTPVTLGPTSGDRVAVLSGLSAGDLVVIDGADMLRNGARIRAARSERRRRARRGHSARCALVRRPR
jgi:multidrug efflux system membrane fusion protein